MLSLLVAASRMLLTVGTRPATSCTPERMFRSFLSAFRVRSPGGARLHAGPAVDLEWRVRGLGPLRGSLGDRAVLTVDQEIRRAELALARFVIVGAWKLRGLLLELRPISVICIATYVAILEAHGGCEPTGASHGTG